MRMNGLRMALRSLHFLIGGLLLSLALSACQPYHELKSNCHVAGALPETGCDFTPIGTKRAS